MGDQPRTAEPRRPFRAVPTAPMLAQMREYRPGLPLAAALILSPALAALAASGLALLVLHRVPLWVPAILLLLLPAIPAGWAAMVFVRTTPIGIGAARLLRPWRDIPWALIERCTRRGVRVTLTASDGRRIAFVPMLLRDGARLYRELLLRLPTQVLDTSMAAEAQMLLAERILPTAEGGLTGSLHARPRGIWRAAALLVGVLALVGGVAGIVWLRPPAGLALGAVAAAALIGSLLIFRWCAQTLDIAHDGIQVAYALPRRRVKMAWSEIQLVEYTPAERLLRLRGDRRLVCAGPELLRPAERDLMRAFLHTYCLDRGVPVARRRWLFSAWSVRV